MQTSSALTFFLNGESVSVQPEYPGQSLLSYLRSSGLCGSKEGCNEGECGSCAVLLVMNNRNGSYYLPVNSCLLLLPTLSGKEVITIEGLANRSALCEIQRTIVEHGGSQCGYCIPGFVINMFSELFRRDGRTPDADSFSGNLCRCTGYRWIAEAVNSLRKSKSTLNHERISCFAEKLSPIYYSSPFEKFTRPGTLAECLEILKGDSTTRIVSGNTELGVQVNMNHAQYEHLVSIECIPELRVFQDTAEYVDIGCGLSIAEIFDIWTSAPPIFSSWVKQFGSPLIRNRATLGGNLAVASPTGDAIPLLLALSATVLVTTHSGYREIEVDELFEGHQKIMLPHDAIFVSVRIPKPYPDQAVFWKVRKRSSCDSSIVSAAFAISFERDSIVSARLAYGGVAPTSYRVLDAEKALIGTCGAEKDFVNARDILEKELQPANDYRGSARYRFAVAGELLMKFAKEVAAERFDKWRK